MMFVNFTCRLLLLLGALALQGRALRAEEGEFEWHTRNDTFSNFVNVREDYKPFIMDKVAKAETAANWIRKGFVPGQSLNKDWSLTSSLGMQESIVSVLYNDLQSTEKPVIDVGSGTGSLVLLLAEFAPRAPETIGLEYNRDASENAAYTSEALGEVSDSLETLMDASPLLQVMNIGFAMTFVPRAFWRALAPGGVLGMPLCLHPLEVSEEDKKCAAKYRVFRKADASSQVPVADQYNATIEKEI
eukprot:CAMPEP_0181494728 /NCGR_PEP_ID=MMETSP1110-20121109/51952_1 /TAXON_ID=174948 /ORGANISM="Symbiodinium sp., Strain CCMP421" /LENGTH=244 /DNA_ID=CAMNT_0023622211 /DNA_START=22 /DNA_END=754 /DNA_ORIENTATION=-